MLPRPTSYCYIATTFSTERVLARHLPPGVAVPDHSPLAAVPILLLALVYAACAPWLRSRPRSGRRALDRLARRVRLPVPDDLRPGIERQLRSHHLGADLGGTAAVAITAIWGLTLGPGVVASTWWLQILFAGALAGAAVGAGLAVLREAARPREGAGPRVARPVAPTLADYVAPVELQGGRLVAVLPTVLLGALVVLRASDLTAAGLLGPAVVAALGLVALAFGELGGRRVLEAPQAAGSDLELAWSDAIRAHTLRAVVTVPIVVGSYASLGVLVSFVDLRNADPLSPLALATAGLLVTLVVAAFGAAFWSATGAPHRWFRDRLWPTDRASFRPASPGGRR